MNDSWLLHEDVIGHLSDYSTGGKGALLCVYSRLETAIEREFAIALSLRERVAKDCLDKPEFDVDIQQADLPITRNAAFGRDFSRRVYNRILRQRFVGRSRVGFFDSKTQEDISTRTEGGRYGQKSELLRLRKDLVLQDLKEHKRIGVFCFEAFRFSERTLEEFGETEREEIFRGDTFVYKRVIMDDRGLRPRMRSAFLIRGKVFIQ